MKKVSVVGDPAKREARREGEQGRPSGGAFGCSGEKRRVEFGREENPRSRGVAGGRDRDREAEEKMGKKTPTFTDEEDGKPGGRGICWGERPGRERDVRWTGGNRGVRRRGAVTAGEEGKTGANDGEEGERIRHRGFR